MPDAPVTLVLDISRGRGFPRSRTVGFVAKCKLVGEERTTRVALGETPFWGDVFSWDVSSALLRKMLDSSPTVKLHLYHLDTADATRAAERPLGYVLLHLKAMQYAAPGQAWHALRPSGGGDTHAIFNSRRYSTPPEVSVQLQILRHGAAPQPGPSVAATSAEPRQPTVESDAAIASSTAAAIAAAAASPAAPTVDDYAADGLQHAPPPAPAPLPEATPQQLPPSSPGIREGPRQDPCCVAPPTATSFAAVASPPPSSQQLPAAAPVPMVSGLGVDEGAIDGEEGAAACGVASELSMQLELPPPAALGALLGVPTDSAGSVTPWVRWMGLEARCLPVGVQGSWQVCLRLGGDLPRVMAALQSASAEPPLLLLRAPPPKHLAAAAGSGAADDDGGTPLAVTALPMARLQRGTDATTGAAVATLDTKLELRAPAGRDGSGADGSADDATAAVRLGLRVRLRERGAAELSARDADRNVHFTVRLRLRSLTLLRAPAAGAPGHSLAAGDDADGGGGGGGRWCAVRLIGYEGLRAPASEAAACPKLGQPCALADELQLPLPNPPFTPRAALEQLQRAPLRLELLVASPPPTADGSAAAAAAAASSATLWGAAPLALHDVCGGQLIRLPPTPETPPGHEAAATAPAQRSIELYEVGVGGLAAAVALPVARLQLDVTLQCTYEHTAAARGGYRQSSAPLPPPPQQPMYASDAVTYTQPATATATAATAACAAADAATAIDAPAVPQLPGASTAVLRYRFVVGIRTVRDLAIPLGAASNVFVRFSYPMLEGAGGVSRAVRSSPPVLLNKGSEVPLPNAAAVFEFGIDPAVLLDKLATTPMLVELWHKDRYVSDLLLGVATVDLAEVLGVTPAVASGGGDDGPTRREQEQTVVVLVPEGAPPPPLANDAAGGAAPPAGAPGSRVAQLSVLLRLEELGPPPPPPPPPPPRPPRAPIDHGAAAAAAAAAMAASPVDAAAEGALLKWRRKEEARWRAALQARQEEQLSLLAREWKVREQKHEQAMLKQRRALLSAEAELKQKLNEVAAQAQHLEQGEHELQLKAAAHEEARRADAAKQAASASREHLRFQAELANARAAQQQAEAREAALAEQLAAAQAREARHEEKEATWRDAHTEGAARSLALQAEVARLGVEAERLQHERGEAAAHAEQRKQQALQAHRELQALRADVTAAQERRLQDELAEERNRNAQLQLRREAEGAHAALQSEAAELRQLRAQLQRLEAAPPSPHSPPPQPEATPPRPTPPPAALPQPQPQVAAAAAGVTSAVDQIARLQAMHDDFISSGLYGANDRVVVLLQQRIAALQAA